MLSLIHLHRRPTQPGDLLVLGQEVRQRRRAASVQPADEDEPIRGDLLIADRDELRVVCRWVIVHAGPFA